LAREDGRLGGGLKPMGETCTAPAPPQAGTQALVEQMPCGQAILGSLFAARGISIARFAEMITGSREQMGVDRLVIDRTSLTGLYTIEVRYTPREVFGLRKPDSQDLLPEFATAIREQLGLKLEPSRSSVDTIMVERIERPTPN